MKKQLPRGLVHGLHPLRYLACDHHDHCCNVTPEETLTHGYLDISSFAFNRCSVGPDTICPAAGMTSFAERALEYKRCYVFFLC